MILLTLGCAGPQAQSTRLSPHPRAGGARSASDVEILPSGFPPKRPVVPIARLETVYPGFSFRNLGGFSESENIEVMREAAAELGGDGVMDLQCAAKGTVGSGLCSGTVFAYEQER